MFFVVFDLLYMNHYDLVEMNHGKSITLIIFRNLVVRTFSLVMHNLKMTQIDLCMNIYF